MMEKADELPGVESGAFSGGVAGDSIDGTTTPGDAKNAAHGAENGALPVITAQEDFRPMPPWMAVALREVGERERAGSEENPRILQYHATTTLKATSDEVPWCSSFVNWVMARTQMERTNSAAAKSWADWGYALEKPIYGALVVLSRSGGNHVGFFVDEDKKGNWILLGGNQGNAVNQSSYPKSRVLSVRWPHGWAELDFRAKK